MGRRANGEGTIYPETDPRRKTKYRAEKDVTLPNGRGRRLIARGKTRKEALAKLAVKERELYRAHPDAEKMTVEQFLEKWLAFKRPLVRASTMRTYQRDAKHATGVIGDVRLAKVTPLDIQEALTKLQAKGHNAQADKVRRTLKQAFSQAVRWELLTSSPLERLDPIHKPKVRRGVWTEDEADVFLSRLRTIGSPYYPIFLAALNTGLRKGELIGLDWRHVTENALLVEQAYSRYAKDRMDKPKTEAGVRRVPVSPTVIAEFGVRRGATDPVFVNRAGRRHSERNLSRALKHHAEACKIPVIRFHDLRRTYATILSTRGVPPRVVQKLLGHSTPDLALTVYQDVYEESVDGAVLGITPKTPPTGRVVN